MHLLSLVKQRNNSLKFSTKKKEILSPSFFLYEKFVFNERFAVNGTINHFYLFCDLLILALWSGSKSSTLSINYIQNRQTFTYTYVLHCGSAYERILLQKSNKHYTKPFAVSFLPIENCSLPSIFVEFLSAVVWHAVRLG